MKTQLALITTLLAAAPFGVFAGEPTTPAKTTGSQTPSVTHKTTTSAYPSAARAAGVQGTVMVECLVAADGTIVTSAVADADAHPLLRDAALEKVAQVRLESLDGIAANGYTVVRIPVRFELDSLKAGVDTTHIVAR